MKRFQCLHYLKNSVGIIPRDLEKYWSLTWFCCCCCFVFFCTWIFQVTRELIVTSSPETQTHNSPGSASLQNQTLNYNCHFPSRFSLLSQLFEPFPHLGVKRCLCIHSWIHPTSESSGSCSGYLWNKLGNSGSFSFNNPSLVKGSPPMPFTLSLQGMVIFKVIMKWRSLHPFSLRYYWLHLNEWSTLQSVNYIMWKTNLCCRQMVPSKPILWSP